MQARTSDEKGIGGGSIWKVGGPSFLSLPSLFPSLPSFSLHSLITLNLFLPSHSFPFLSLPLLPSEVRPLNEAMVSGKRCKLPSGVWGETPAHKRFGAYLSQKSSSSCESFLWILVKRNNFLHKNSHNSLPSMLQYIACLQGRGKCLVYSWWSILAVDLVTNADPEGTDERARIGVEKVLRRRGREDERPSVEVRDATPNASTTGYGIPLSNRLLGVRGAARELLYSGVLAEPRPQTDFCKFPNSKALQNVSCRDVCRNWRLVRRSLLMEKT